MMRFHITRVAALFACCCACEVVETSTTEQAGTTMQGTTMQGTTMQGTTMQGTTMQGFQFAGATLGGVALMNLRVQQGELVAEQNQVTRRGASLIGAHLRAQVRNPATNPPVTALIEYRITNVVQEDSKYDPTQTGSTFLYTLEQNVDNSGSWQPACPVDADGRRVAIPLAAMWNEHGDRIESSSLFTFGCTTGVIAKCYRWGYRPWVTGYGDLAAMHWTCTRLARADYCGNGVPHTRNGTWINIWDNLPSPGPIQQHGGGLLQLPPPGMLFEAGWSTSGAVCLSHARWITGGNLIAQACPDRLIPPSPLGGTVCDLMTQVLGCGSSPRMFNEAYINIDLF
jgi:ADYC domain